MWRPKDPARSWSRKQRPLVERFWEKVAVREPNDCWFWLGAKGRHGYGNIGAGNGMTLRAHRVSYELAYGAIPAGFVVCHQCDEPLCVNPAHLRAASQFSNLREMVDKGRAARGERSAGARLNCEPVQTIRSSEAKQVDLARHFGVCPMTVSLAKRKLTWRCL